MSFLHDTQHDLKEGTLGIFWSVIAERYYLHVASSFAVIRFRCHRCQAKCVCKSSTSHEQVRCGCGEVLPIPKVVLKRPIRVLEAGGSGGSSLRRLTDRETSSASGFDVVKMNEMIADQKEQKETAEAFTGYTVQNGSRFPWVLTRCRANRQKW